MKTFRKVMILSLAMLAIGCASDTAFHNFARQGDSVAIPSGWKQTFRRDNITVTITEFDNPANVYTYGPDHVDIRGVSNLYLDPLSSMVVSRQLGVNLTPFALAYNNSMQVGATGDDDDYWQSLVVIDLPVAMNEGRHDVVITTPEGESTTARVNIIAGDGTQNPMRAAGSGPLNEDQFRALERVAHDIITFTGGASVPHALEVDFTHDADADHGGTGYAYVVNPLGYIKNVAWSANATGTGLKVIITPARDGEITQMAELKFYVAGGINNLAISSVQAFDATGATVLGVIGQVN